MLKVRLTSVLPLSYRDELERIVFFNPHQSRFIDPLLAAVNSYGVPAIVEEGEESDRKTQTQAARLRLRVPTFPSIQTLYALAEDLGSTTPVPAPEPAPLATLAGVVAFVREKDDTMLVLHLAVHQDYTAEGPHADGWIAVRLMKAVRDAGRLTRGVEWLRILYPKPARYGVRRSP